MPAGAQRTNARGRAALAVGLLALGMLVLVLSLAALQADPLPCQGSFYRGAPPGHAVKSGLRMDCHALADGRSFVTVQDPGSGAAVYTAFRLSPHNAWGRGAAPEGDGSGTADASHESAAFVPALYQRGRHAAPPASASPLQEMDALTAEVVESRVVPLCSEAGGDVYVQSGVGGLNGCQAGVLWSAACCAAPDASFGVGMLREEGAEMSTVSVEELEQRVGVQELFSGGCGEPPASRLTDSLHAYTLDQHVAEVDKEPETAETAETLETPETAPQVLALGDQDELEETSEDEDRSVLLYILSSVASILCAPFYMVASTLANLLSQFAYVLWEDCAVLAAVPGDGLALTQNLASGVASGVGGVWDVAFRVGEAGVGSVCTCVGTLGSTLLLSFQQGLVGTGTLACDALGLAIGALKEGWDVGVGVAGWACQQVGGYLGTVGSEMGQQACVLGEGVGNLVWRSQRGASRLLYVLWGVVGGVVENTVGNVQEALGGE